MATQFFRVDGADQETGEDTYLVLQADTKPQAEQLARDQGLLISAVRVAEPDDWGKPPAQPDDWEQPPADPLQAPPPQDPPSPQEPQVDVRRHRYVERNADAAPTEDPDSEAGFEPERADTRLAAGHAPFVHVEMVEEPVAAASTGGSPAVVVLACVGAALIIGGVLGLVLALWPDNSVRNELQQVDFRLHEVSQIVLGAMLFMGGMIVSAVAAVCYLTPRNRG